MNDSTQITGDALANASSEEIMTALFANMVIQQTNMAMMMLGKMAHPESGQFFHDVEAAKMFIDQLEMLEFKTRGNLSRQEEGLLKQGLTALRMAFVEAVDESNDGSQPPPPAPDEAPAPAETAQSAPAPAPATPGPAPEPTAEESRKKFSKKY